MKALHLGQSEGDKTHSPPASPLPGSMRMSEPILTVLVVDSDPVFREFQAQTLCDQGYKVLKAPGAAEALRLAGNSAAIHLLLTDSVLPEIDGLELTRRFRAVHPETPVLMFTDSLRLPSHGTDNPERLAVLGKPFDVDELVRKVRTLLDTAAPLPIRKPSRWPPA
jgi:DNA-binding response OmpR family regulator